MAFQGSLEELPLPDVIQLVAASGKTGKFSVSSRLGFPPLDQAAVDAVKRWKFKPATLNGKPVDVYYNLTVNFRLQ